MGKRKLKLAPTQPTEVWRRAGSGRPRAPSALAAGRHGHAVLFSHSSLHPTFLPQNHPVISSWHS